MRLARALRLVLAAGFTALVGAAGPACPSRDLEVQITSDGASTLVVACESFRNACGPGLCQKNRFLCNQDTCELRNACTAGDNPEWTPDLPMGMRLLLLQVTPSGVAIQSASPCVPLNLRPCIRDPTEVYGCSCITNPLGGQTCGPDVSGEATLGCIRDTLAQSVNIAMGSGMSFSGFTSTDGVSLVAAFFQASGDQAPCTGGVLVNPTDCAPQNLTAAAGLAAPSGGGTVYDITCASCQGGTHTSYGNDNAPCPVTDTACFLQSVRDALVTVAQ